MKACWLCNGKGRWYASDVKYLVQCGLCNGAGKYEPLKRPRPNIQVGPDVVLLEGVDRLSGVNALFAAVWSKALTNTEG